MNAKLSYVPDAVQAFIYLLCKTYNYLCTCSTFKYWSGSRSRRGLLHFLGCNSCSLSSGDSACLCICVCELFPLYSNDWLKKKKKEAFSFLQLLSIYICPHHLGFFQSHEERKELFQECFHIPAIWDGSCHLSPLTTMFGTQSPSQNLVWWQILSPPFITWSWKISSVLLAWFDLWSLLRAKISQDERKLEGIKKKNVHTLKWIYCMLCSSNFPVWVQCIAICMQLLPGTGQTLVF